MVTEYTGDVSHWEEWQKEYRYGVILIVPPDPPLGQVDELRARYDPIGQEICRTHISLTVPLMREIGEADWAELQKIAAGIKPVNIYYGPLTSFLPDSACIFLAIEPKRELEKIVARIERAAVFNGAPSRKLPFIPHMTITEFVGLEKSTEKIKDLMEELKDFALTGSFLCEGLSYMVPDVNFHFTERGKLKLSLREKPDDA
jgi:2'-5' RNA ligase